MTGKLKKETAQGPAIVNIIKQKCSLWRTDVLSALSTVSLSVQVPKSEDWIIVKISTKTHSMRPGFRFNQLVFDFMWKTTEKTKKPLYIPKNRFIYFFLNALKATLAEESMHFFFAFLYNTHSATTVLDIIKHPLGVCDSIGNISKMLN